MLLGGPLLSMVGVALVALVPPEARVFLAPEMTSFWRFQAHYFIHEYTYVDIGSFEHNRNFWAQKLQHFCNFWAQKSDCSITAISGPGNCRISAISGPRNCSILTISGPRNRLQHFRNFWAQKCLLACWVGFILFFPPK